AARAPRARSTRAARPAGPAPIPRTSVRSSWGAAARHKVAPRIDRRTPAPKLEHDLGRAEAPDAVAARETRARGDRDRAQAGQDAGPAAAVIDHQRQAPRRRRGDPLDDAGADGGDGVAGAAADPDARAAEPDPGRRLAREAEARDDGAARDGRRQRRWRRRARRTGG